MKTILLIPLLFLVSCSTAAIHSSGQRVGDDFFNNGRAAENMDYSIVLLERMQKEGGTGHVVFWRADGKDYFTAMRKVREGEHYGPNPSRGYYTRGREVVLVDHQNIPWERILAIRAKA